MIVTSSRVPLPPWPGAALDASGDDKQRAAWLVTAAPHFAAQPDNHLAAVIPPLPNLWR